MIITEANAASIRLLGDQLVGSSLDQKIDFAGLSEEFATCIKTGKVVDFTTTPTINHYRHIRGRMMTWGDDRVIVLLMDMTLQHNLEKMRRDFIANVSHELRSPLTSLIGFIETMQNTSELDQSMRDRFLKNYGRRSKAHVAPDK